MHLYGFLEVCWIDVVNAYICLELLLVSRVRMITVGRSNSMSMYMQEFYAGVNMSPKYRR